MATVASIRADLVGSSAVFRSAMISGQQQANQSLTAIQAQAKSTAQAISNLSLAAKSFVGFESVKAGVSALLDAQKAVQQIHYTLLSATGSGGAADAAYASVASTADKLGLSLQTAELGFAQMSAAATANGISMAQQQALFNGVARSATVLHLSADQSGSAILALSQIFGKGKIQAQELQLQLGQAIPGVVPRFQQAVMKMIQGTDLAGKSFQQLLEGGDLTVQRFLPALIDALNQTGKGAEGAATGLNAETNRLSTAWFKLKADLSGGLFSDVAVASIKLMSANLGNLASAAGITAGVLGARFVGNGLQSGVSATQTFSQQNVTGPKMAAAAEAAYTEALAARTAQQALGAEAAALSNTIYIEAAAESAAAAKALQFEALAAHEAAVAEVERTTVLLESMKAEGGSAVEIASRNVQLARQEGAFTALAVATQTLTAAQVKYDAAVTTGNRLQADQLLLTQRSAAAQEASAAASAAAAVAKASVSTTSTASLLARGLSGVGSAALGLVGGPLGALVLTVGAVGYAMADANEKAEEYRQVTEGQADSLKKLREQVQGATADFASLHSTMGLNQAIDLFKGSSENLTKQRADLADLEKQAADLQTRIDSRSGEGATDGGAIANWFDQRSLDQITDRIKALKDQLPGTTDAVNDLGTKLAGNLTGAINGVRTALDNLKSGASFADILGAISGGVDKGIAEVNTARDNVTKGLSDMAAAAKNWQKTADDAGKTPGQIARQSLQKIIDNINAQKLVGDQASKQIADAQQQAAPAIKAADAATNALAAKKAAESAATSTKHWQDQVTSLNDTLAKQHDELAAQLDSTTKLTPAQNLLAQILGGSNEAYNHATAAIQKKILAEAQDNAQLSLQVAAQEQQRKSLELTAALQDKLNERIAARTDQNAIDVAGVGHGQELTQQLQDELKIRQDYAKQVDDLNKQANNPSNLGTTNGIGGDDYNSRLAMISAGQQQELAIYRAGVQQRLAAESDWSNGARASFEDYIANAANVAGQTQTMFTNAFQGMEDALVTFATTGKLSFTSLANGIISDLARMQVKIIESQALQALLNAFSPGAGAFSSLGGSSSSYSSINNGQFSGGFDLASGRAAGGSVSPKQMYEVAEHGKPELLQSGGRTYLMTGQGGGTVTPATKNVSPGSTGGGGMNVTFAVDIQNNTTAKVSTKQSTGSDGMPKMSVFIDQIDEAMAGRVTNGTSKTARAIGARSGTNMNGTL